MIGAKTLLILAGLNGLMAVAASAGAAHALKGRLSEQMLGWFSQAAQFQLWHALALMGLGAWALAGKEPFWPGLAGLGLQLGILLFCGTLYVLAFKGPGSLGGFHWLTPIGGLALMAGWGLVILGAIKQG